MKHFKAKVIKINRFCYNAVSMLFSSLTKMFLVYGPYFLIHILCVFLCIHTHPHILIEHSWKPSVDIRRFPQSPSTYFLEQCVSVNLTRFRLDCLLGIPRSQLLLPLGAGVMGVYRTLSFLTRGSRIQAVVFRLAGQHSTYGIIYLVLVYPHCNNGVRALNFSQCYGENGTFRHF